ncbi:MAG: hypothetical protein NTX85_01915 [Candidatus Nomurabacteria bacterium]|nr:hypothetical protein [Candidatus Nomurabacteria bacterium]
MKKYTPIILIFTFMIPSVVFASWWNPFSWKVFQKKEAIQKIQNQEQKISEFQKKIDNLNKEQSNSPSEIINTKSSRSTQKSINTNVRKNFNYISLALFDSLIKRNNEDIEYVQKNILIIDKAIKDTTERKDLINSQNIYNDKAFSLIVKQHENYIESYLIYKNYLEGMIPILNNNLLVTKEGRAKNESSFIEDEKTANEYSLWLMKSQGYLNQQDVSKNILRASDDFIKKYEKNEADFKQMLIMYKNYIETNKQTTSFTLPTSYYQPTIIPKIQIPKTTYCTMRGTGVNGTYDISCN